MIRAAAFLCLLATPIDAAGFNFCWAGNGGYTMTGRIEFPDELMGRIITERDVTEFEIIGYEFGVAIGRWNMNDRTPSTTWHLRFDPRSLTFPTGGSFPGELSQGWNADGEVTDCGQRGFGFNSGNYAQDICLYGVWIAQSSIPPETPLRATPNPVSPDCRAVDFLGKSGKAAK